MHGLLSGHMLHSRKFHDAHTHTERLGSSHFKDAFVDGEGIQQIFVCPYILNLLSEIKTSIVSPDSPKYNKLHIKSCSLEKLSIPTYKIHFISQKESYLGEVQEYVYLSNYSIKNYNLPNMS